jgi:hypothetical protein
MEASHPFEPLPDATEPAKRPRRKRLWPLVFLAIPLFVGSAALWFNEPLDRPLETPPPGRVPLIQSAEAVTSPARSKPEPSGWPKGRVEGLVAKRYLLEFLLAAKARLDKTAGYTAIFHKHERLDGKLGPEQIMEMKVRHRPFSVYLKNRTPKSGREVLFVEGKHDNKLIAHNNDLSALLVPRLALDPNGRLALAENRHPITDIGLANLVTKLVGFRRMDLEDQDAKTVLDQIIDHEGRGWYRSLHVHSRQSADRPFQRIEVLYDPVSRLPHQITSFEWPKPGAQGDDLELGEKYTYNDVNINAPLDDDDFSTANPEYAFQRRIGGSAATK